MAKKEDFQKGTNAVLDEIMTDFRNEVNKGEYTPFYSCISPDSRQMYADLFRKNFDLAVKKLKSGEISSLNEELVRSTCWVGPNENLIDNPYVRTNPLLAGTKVATGSAKSDYAEKLAKAIKDSKITSVEFPAFFATNGVAVWKTTQEERDIIMSALPPTVKKFSNHYWGEFTNKDLQNLTDLMNRVPGIEIHLDLTPALYPYLGGQFGPFDDKTYADFVNAAKKSDGVYITYATYNRPLTDCSLFNDSKKRVLMLEKALGAKAVETTFGFLFDKNYKTKMKNGAEIYLEETNKKGLSSLFRFFTNGRK